MKTIPLTKCLEALVDDDDFVILSQWKWSVFRTKGHKDYAYRWDRNEDGKRIRVFMHRAILGVSATEHTDHIDGNGMNNTRLNLRPATCSQNLANRGKQRNNTSGFKGVTWNKKLKAWISQIKIRGEQKHIGVFQTAEEAAMAYDRVALESFGEYAVTNIMFNYA